MIDRILLRTAAIAVTLASLVVIFLAIGHITAAPKDVPSEIYLPSCRSGHAPPCWGDR
jgi:hypothetical protein